jgi:hypothetical protein
MLTLQLLTIGNNVIVAAGGLLAVQHHTARTRVSYSSGR